VRNINPVQDSNSPLFFQVKFFVQFGVGKGEGIFKNKEGEPEGKAIPIFPIIETTKELGNSNFHKFGANISNNCEERYINRKIETEKEMETHNPLVRRLPKVQKRSHSKRVEGEEKQLKKQVS